MSDNHWACCILCDWPIFLPHLQEEETAPVPLPGNGLRYASGVVKLCDRPTTTGTADVYYCSCCAPDLVQCRVCGCTEEAACIGGCYWVEADLCSRCALALAEADIIRRLAG